MLAAGKLAREGGMQRLKGVDHHPEGCTRASPDQAAVESLTASLERTASPWR